MSDLDTVLGLENAMVYHSATLPVPTDSTVWHREERMGKWDTLNYAKIKFARGTHKKSDTCSRMESQERTLEGGGIKTSLSRGVAASYTGGAAEKHF